MERHPPRETPGDLLYPEVCCTALDLHCHPGEKGSRRLMSRLPMRVQHGGSRNEPGQARRLFDRDFSNVGCVWPGGASGRKRP